MQKSCCWDTDGACDTGGEGEGLPTHTKAWYPAWYPGGIGKAGPTLMYTQARENSGAIAAPTPLGGYMPCRWVSRFSQPTAPAGPQLELR